MTERLKSLVLAYDGTAWRAIQLQLFLNARSYDIDVHRLCLAVRRSDCASHNTRLKACIKQYVL